MKHLVRIACLLSLSSLSACGGCDDPANDGPDAPTGDGGSGSSGDGDGGTGDGGGGGLITPTCYAYGPGGPNTEVPANGLVRVGDRLYWGTSATGQENQVHSIRTDFTDYVRYDNQVGVVGIAANASGVFWLNRALDSTAGLYRLTTGTPQLVTQVSGGSLVAADDGNVIYLVRTGLDYAFHRAGGDGTSGASWFSGSSYDQVEITGGYFYYMATTIEANASVCPMPSTNLRQVVRVPAASAVPSALETAMNGCGVLAVSDRPYERLTRIAIDGSNVYATSVSGNVYRSAITGGTVTRLFQPLNPGPGGGIAIVGTNLVWVDGGSELNGVPRGIRKMPLAGGTSTVFANQIAAGIVTDGTAIYFATHQNVCKIVVP